MPEKAAGITTRMAVWNLRGAHRIGTFAQMHGYGTHRVFRHGTDIGNNHDAHHQSSGKQTEAWQFRKNFLQQGRNKQ